MQSKYIILLHNFKYLYLIIVILSLLNCETKDSSAEGLGTSKGTSSTEQTARILSESNANTNRVDSTEYSFLVGIWETIPDTSWINELKSKYPEASVEDLEQLIALDQSITSEQYAFNSNGRVEWINEGLSMGLAGTYTVDQTNNVININVDSEDFILEISEDYKVLTKTVEALGETAVSQFHRVTDDFRSILSKDMAQNLDQFMNQNNLQYIDPITGEPYTPQEMRNTPNSQRSARSNQSNGSNATSEMGSSSDDFFSRMKKANEMLGQAKRDIASGKSADEIIDNIQPKSGTPNSRLKGAWIISSVYAKDGNENSDIYLLRELEVGTRYEFKRNGQFKKTRTNSAESLGSFVHNSQNLTIVKENGRSTDYRIQNETATELTMLNNSNNAIYVLKRAD